MPWTTRSQDPAAQRRPLQPRLAMSRAGRNDSPSIDGGLVGEGPQKNPFSAFSFWGYL